MITEVVDAFLDAMKAVGIAPAEDIRQRLQDGQPIYFDCEGDKPRSRKGWAVLHLDHRPAGAFGHFKSEISQRWKAEGPASKVDPAERLRRRREIEANKRKRDAEQQDRWLRVALQLRTEWEEAEAARSAHPYLMAKRIAGEGLRQSSDALLVPMYDADGVLWNIQSIYPNGRKLYAKGARQKGLFLLLGEPDDRLVVAEGYGTGSVIRRATGLPVAIAFSWSNLAFVALTLREQFPDAEIIIGADDDAHLVNHPKIKRNVGLEAARAAAQAVGGRVAVPSRGAAQ